MRDLYSITRSQEAMRRLFRLTRDLTGNLPALLLAIYPDTMAPVIRIAPDGERELTLMRWGFPPPPNLGKAAVTNVRDLKSPFWRGWLKAEWRCLVSATSFCEWTDSRPKITHWFALDEILSLFAFAGIWRLWTGERKGELTEHRLFDDIAGMGHLAHGHRRRSDDFATALAERCVADRRDRRKEQSRTS